MATSSIFQSPVYETEEEVKALLEALEASEARMHEIPEPRIRAQRPEGDELKAFMHEVMKTVDYND